MSRIEACFATLKEQQRKALIPYITAGDPTKAVTVPVMHAMVEAGADVIELGVPFSDPMADGPVIQKACGRATPVVLMGYLNPVEIMGYERFADACVDAGVDGVLLVDLPPEECDEVAPLFKTRGVDLIFLIAPTTTDARISRIAGAASGYLYYVSLKGVTGSASLNVEEVARRVETIRNLAQLPIGVGFGIKDAQSARAVSQVSDGVVVGSALVNQSAENVDTPDRIAPAVAAILADMRAAMDKQ